MCFDVLLQEESSLAMPYQQATEFSGQVNFFSPLYRLSSTRESHLSLNWTKCRFAKLAGNSAHIIFIAHWLLYTFCNACIFGNVEI